MSRLFFFFNDPSTLGLNRFLNDRLFVEETLKLYVLLLRLDRHHIAQRQKAKVLSFVSLFSLRHDRHDTLHATDERALLTYHLKVYFVHGKSDVLVLSSVHKFCCWFNFSLFGD